MIEATGNGNSQGNLARRACRISEGGGRGEERTMWGEAGCKKKKRRKGGGRVSDGLYLVEVLTCSEPKVRLFNITCLRVWVTDPEPRNVNATDSILLCQLI